MKGSRDDDVTIPLLFALWAFVFLLVIGFWSVAIYIGYSIASNPASIGLFLGELVGGFREALP